MDDACGIVIANLMSMASGPGRRRSVCFDVIPLTAHRYLHVRPVSPNSDRSSRHLLLIHAKILVAR
jgi:hypothetical protein